MSNTSQSPPKSGEKSKRDVLESIAHDVEREGYSVLTADDLKTLRLRHQNEERLTHGTGADVVLRDARIEASASGRPVGYRLFRVEEGGESYGLLVKCCDDVEDGSEFLAKGVGDVHVTGQGVRTEKLQDRVGDLLAEDDTEVVDEWITAYEEDLADYALAAEVSAGVDTRYISMVETDPTCIWGELRDELGATLSDQEWDVVAEAIKSAQTAAASNHSIKMSFVDYQVEYTLDHTVLLED